jgi:hypothetical protein
MPIVAASAANLPNGGILSWSAHQTTGFGGENGRTETSIFNVGTKQSTQRLVTETQHDMVRWLSPKPWQHFPTIYFCSFVLELSTLQILES